MGSCCLETSTGAAAWLSRQGEGLTWGGPAAISWKIPPEVRGQTRHSEGQTPWGICLESFPTPGKGHRQESKTIHPHQHTHPQTTLDLFQYTQTHTHTPVHTLEFVCTDMYNRMQVPPARLWFTAFGRPCYGSQAAPVWVDQSQTRLFSPGPS